MSAAGDGAVPRYRGADGAGGSARVVAPLTVTQMLQNPMGAEAPPGEAGDFVRVSDGRATVYLTCAEFGSATDAHLRWLLAEPGLQQH